jgi:hypothetical protein
MISHALSWLTWSNPVAVWWNFLVAVSAVNIALLLALHAGFRQRAAARPAGAFAIEPLLWLCTAYVIGCAFRSVLPRADVQRICLFDTWLSSVLVGRSIATVAELCFAVQWAIVLRKIGRLVDSNTAKNVSKMIVPLIVLAECCSWYAVITTNYLGNVLENSLWTATFLLIGLALLRLLPRFRGIVLWAIAATVAGVACYCVFMVTVDVPMYLLRWQAQEASGHALLGLVSGLHDVTTRWIVTYDVARWRYEIPWMSLYFSVAVWMSVALGGFGLIRHLLPRYQIRPALLAAGNTAVATASSVGPRQ